jgi:hypothetical protein
MGLLGDGFLPPWLGLVAGFEALVFFYLTNSVTTNIDPPRRVASRARRMDGEEGKCATEVAMEQETATNLAKADDKEAVADVQRPRGRAVIKAE